MKDSQSSKKKNKKNLEIRTLLDQTLSFHTHDLRQISLKKMKIEWLILPLIPLNFLLLFIILSLIYKIQTTKVTDFSNNIRIHSYPLFSSNQNFDISARSAIVFEKNSRVVVYSKNGNLQFTPASTTKIMTAIVSLENYPLDKIIEAKNLDGVEGSRMGLYTGEQIKVIDLLYGLMLPSGNDAAYVLASNYPGGTRKFVEAMNFKAKELKLSNTHFLDPSGYEDGNYTTAFDLAQLASYALSNETLQDIVKTKYKVVYDTSFKRSHVLENLNKLLYEDGVNGVKTGFTEEAGGVLITSFVEKEKTYIIVVLKSQDRFSDSREIIRNVIKNVQLLSY